MSYNSRQVTPLKGKKRVSQNSSKRQKSVTQISSPKKEFNHSSKVISIGTKFKKIPGWLKSLRILENSSTFLAFCLISSTLGVYAWTVLTQQTWSRQYRNLENLQRQERDFTATSEGLKHQLAEQAQVEILDLVPATPEKSLFLKAVNQSKTKTFSSEKEAQVLPKNKNLQPIKIPLGY